MWHPHRRPRSFVPASWQIEECCPNPARTAEHGEDTARWILRSPRNLLMWVTHLMFIPITNVTNYDDLQFSAMFCCNLWFDSAWRVDNFGLQCAIGTRCPGLGRGKKRQVWDFSRVKAVHASGTRSEQFHNLKPYAKPDFIDYYVNKAPSYERRLVKAVRLESR